MKAVNFIYNGHTVEFEPSGNDNVMVNATQMAKIFGKLPKDFLKNDDTQNFIQACLRRSKSDNNRFLITGKKENSPFLDIKNESDLVDSKQKSGTWMHRILALKFAAWLDADFEVWIFTTIDNLILGHYRDQRDAMIKTLSLKQRIEAKKQEVLLTHPEIAELFDIEDELKQAKNRQATAIREQLNQLSLDFTSKQKQ